MVLGEANILAQNLWFQPTAIRAKRRTKEPTEWQSSSTWPCVWPNGWLERASPCPIQGQQIGETEACGAHHLQHLEPLTPELLSAVSNA